MKKFLYILLFTTSACSSDKDYDLLEQTTTPEPLGSVNLESQPALNRNTANLIFVENFENPALRNDKQAGDFYLEHTAAHSFQLEQNIIREGSTASRFEIRKGDPQIYGGHRSEMAQITSTTLEEGWYGFSQYFPDSYISDPIGEVVGQWHDQPDAGETTARSPSNAIITSDNRIKWMLRWDSTRIKLDNNSEGHMYFDLGAIPKNKWIDWVVHIKYSHTNTGILEVWMDGVKVIDRQNMPNSYNDEKYPYFKFGVYKWEWGVAANRIIYYDEVRIGNKNSSYDEVKPSGLNEVIPVEPGINMMVKSNTVACYGEMEGTCLLVQEGDMIGTGKWVNFYYYDSIEGFTYQPGFVYGLIVKKTAVVNPPADGSSIRYQLVKIVSKEVSGGSQDSEPSDSEPSEMVTSDPVAPGNRNRPNQNRPNQNRPNRNRQ